MADFEFTIEGLDETVAMLEQAPRRIVERGYRKALQAGANVIAQVLKEHTPVKQADTGGLLEKGELRELITTEIELDRGGVAIIGFDEKAANVPLWLEYGTRKVSAHPFMRPAAEAAAEAAVDAFAESLTQTVTEEFPQGRGRAA